VRAPQFHQSPRPWRCEGRIERGRETERVEGRAAAAHRARHATRPSSSPPLPRPFRPTHPPPPITRHNHSR
jgi:hypothetical protein